MTSENANGIGTHHETSLHAALKAWYAHEGDRIEASVDGYIIDVVRGDLLIEIQTRGFAALTDKLTALLEEHPVRLVHPIARERWIVRLNADGAALGRRKSPKRGRVEHLFAELVRFPALIRHPGFTLEVLLTREEEMRCDDGRGSWRRKGWSIVDRRLIAVDERIRLESAGDLRALLPAGLPQPFTTLDLAEGLGVPRRLAQQMTYCLRAMGAIEAVGRKGRTRFYEG
jgi:hypothetical protein